jgi:hypothetical protein
MKVRIMGYSLYFARKNMAFINKMPVAGHPPDEFRDHDPIPSKGFKGCLNSFGLILARSWGTEP